jgi:peptidoglycan hydrolase-like protein with peptidoglycan-binding domain
VPPSFRRLVLTAAAAVVCCGTVTAPAAMARKSTGTHLGDRALRPGTTGTDVRELQTALREAGFPVKVDGHFGPSTVRAVKQFQRAVELTDSGVVGRKTAEALRRAARAGSVSGGTSVSTAKPVRPSLGRRVPLRRGMRGHDVRVLQDLLGNAGYDVTVDGEYGSRTYRAVKAFERRTNRPVDGVIDAGDIEALRVAADQGPPVVEATPVAEVTAAGDQATIGPDGLAIAPASAPEPVRQIIAAGNRIATKPYKYGGGHGKWEDSGYDCSGSVSYALHGAGLLERAMPSSGFVGWGEPGPGQWVTIYAHGGHMYMVVAGLRFDTSGRTKNNTRWQTEQRSTSGYSVSHPPGL